MNCQPDSFEKEYKCQAGGRGRTMMPRHRHIGEENSSHDLGGQQAPGSWFVGAHSCNALAWYSFKLS